MVDEALRGYVYQFEDGRGTTNKPRYCLVISNNLRSTDKLVSVIIAGDSKVGHDVVELRYNKPTSAPYDGIKYVHCGINTFTNRDYLFGEGVKVSDATMSIVDRKLAQELGLTEGEYYKKAYLELLNTLRS